MAIKTDDKNQLNPPFDFDDSLRTSILMKVQNQEAKQPDAHKEFIQAWGALQYRFYACSDHDEAFTESFRVHGDAPIQPYRYQQERELFNFFINGLSAIECLCYGFFAIDAMVDKKQFPFKTDGQRRAIKPKTTGERYNAAFPTEAVSLRLKMMLSSPEYEEWQDMRRLLYHRIHPGRNFNLGGTGRLPTTWLMGKAVDQDSTSIPRKWLASTVKELLGGAESFAFGHL
jgi:hypothetical protein